MLSKTTRLYRRDDGGAAVDLEQPVTYLETVRDKLEIIMEQLQAEKKLAQQRWQNQRKALSDEIQAKDAKIEKLEVRVRQLQRENEQIRYQHGQRVALMGILKQQNALLSRQYAQEKQRMRKTIDLLLNHTNSCLTPSPKSLLLAKPQQFYSMTDLHNTPFPKLSHSLPRRLNNQSEEQASLGRELEVSTGEFSEGDWEQSRVTRVKGRQVVAADRMSAVTYLSRSKGRH